ncbi:hypothetical protein [Mycolicibacterium fortuitum]|nr:hypothetical protein [Mycolicibacterium fortuitum]WEV30180.1 hypothetical protein OMF10_15690 [Mycolicibacterium fortuitum]BDD99034.1 hypothetical protein MFTT_31280 [Mycolicibacterium fortuitum subsp. fortuitum]
MLTSFQLTHPGQANSDVTYPCSRPIVRLVTVLSDMAWRRRLLANDRAKRGKAMRDLFELVLDGDTPYRTADPIYEWRLRQLAAKDGEKPRRSVSELTRKKGSL